jgi:hypothetical protein
MAELVGHLPSKLKALGSIPNTSKQIKLNLNLNLLSTYYNSSHLKLNLSQIN